MNMIDVRFCGCLLVSTIIAHVSGLDPKSFSASLQQAVVDMLGSGHYEVTSQYALINILTVI